MSGPTPSPTPSPTPIIIVPAILETLLSRLALLFLAGACGNPEAARQAAHQMLDSFLPETTAEARLAAKIISFDFHALEALSQAAEPGIPITRILRLRGGAVSLSRESRRCQERLDKLQAARQAGETCPEPEITATAAESDPTPAKIEKAITLVAETRDTLTALKSRGLPWSQNANKHLMAQKIAANLKKNHGQSLPA